MPGRRDSAAKPIRSEASSAQLSDLLLVLGHHLSEFLINENVGKPDVIDDEPHTGDQPLKLFVTANRVNLLRRAPQQDEATEISTLWGENGHVKALDFSFF